MKYYFDILKRGRLASFFFHICLWVIMFFFGGQVLGQEGDMPFEKNAVRNFTFGATSGQVVPNPRHRLDPTQNFIVLNGETATLQYVPILNSEMGSNGIGGYTHEGSIHSLEIFKKTNLIEISFIVNSATTKIRVMLDFWDDGSTNAIIEPLNSRVSLKLKGNMYKIGSLGVVEGANR